MSDKSSDFSAIATTLINAAAVFGFPTAVPFVSMVNPLLSKIIERGFRLFHREDTVQVECARLGIAYGSAVQTINDSLSSGKKVREDGFMEAFQNSQYTQADEIIEASLRNVISDAETLKSVYYGRFIGHTPFLAGTPVNELISINSILKQLTVDDISNLQLFSDRNEHDLTDLDNEVKNSLYSGRAHLFSSYLHLKNLGLITRIFPASTGLDLEKERITRIGIQVLDVIGGPLPPGMGR